MDSPGGGCGGGGCSPGGGDDDVDGSVAGCGCCGWAEIDVGSAEPFEDLDWYSRARTLDLYSRSSPGSHDRLHVDAGPFHIDPEVLQVFGLTLLT